MRHVFIASLLVAAALTVSTGFAADANRRVLTADDINALHEVSDPHLSADGAWVAYAVRTSDLGHDERVTHLWMSSWDGKQTLQLTNAKEGEHTPRWSPDGKSLAFLSSRPSTKDQKDLYGDRKSVV